MHTQVQSQLRLVAASDIETKTPRWVWFNREEETLLILKTHKIQPFINRLYNIKLK